MKETRFINQNKKKWAEFETLLKKKTKDPNRLSDLYVQITDDLSYSKTYYKNRLVRAYLNNLSQKIYLSVYKNKKTPLSRFFYFWKEEIPFIIYQCRKELIISFVVFALAVIIGAVSVLNDPDYAEIVTSPSYVRMTEENIKNGDPMAVYKDENPMTMFLAIAWNNIKVTFNVFALGALAGVGTIMMLLLNGTMLGGFQFFFWDKGVFAESVITVWQHGTIEILCIIIAGGAGIVLGKGLIAPGSYPRLQSFQLAARKGLIIMISLIPFILIAAFIEGFITRLTDAPLLFRIGMIVISFLVMFGYYVYYPFIKNKRGFDEELKFEKPMENKQLIIPFDKIKDAPEVFSNAFSLYINNFGRFAIIALLIGIVYGGLNLFYFKAESFYFDFYDFWSSVWSILEITLQRFFTFFKNADQIGVVIANLALIAIMLHISTNAVMRFKGDKHKGFKTLALRLGISLTLSVLVNAFFFLDNAIMYIAFVSIIPFAALIHTAVYDENHFFRGIQYGFSAFFQKIGDSLLLWLMLVVIMLLFSTFNTSVIVVWLVDFISQNFVMESSTMEKFYTFVSSFLGAGVFSLIFPVFFIAFGLQYFSALEKGTARNLQLKIKALFS